MTLVFRQGVVGKSVKIDFHIGDRFTMVPFINALDPLRVANNASGKKLFEWRTILDDGEPIKAINAMILPVDAAISDVRPTDNMFMFIGFDPLMALPQMLANWLHKLMVSGCSRYPDSHSGGLLNGNAATIHRNYRESINESLPNIS